MASDADRLLDGIAIESYVQKFVQLKKKGANYWGLCPFHQEKTPSFSVAPEKGIFKCFGCGKGGNVISFVMEYERANFKEALKVLSDYSGIELEFQSRPEQKQAASKKEIALSLNTWVKKLFQEKLKGSPAERYLLSRKLKPEIIEKFELGFAPEAYRFLEGALNQSEKDNAKALEYKLNLLFELGLLGKNQERNETYNRFRGRLMFPIRDVRDKVIAFGGRILTEQKNVGKYVNSPESFLFLKKNNLYNLNNARESIRQEGQAILVEGYFDVIGLAQAGIENAIAPLGTAFTTEQAKVLKRYSDKVIFFFDSDGAGIEASFKSAKIAKENQLEFRVVVQKDSEHKSDPFDLAMNLDQIDLVSTIDDAKSEVPFFLWYYFSFKNDINTLEGKRSALLSFFEFLTELKYDWERLEYLKQAAVVLDTEARSMQSDFNRFISGKPQQVRQEETKEENVLKLEKATSREEQALFLLLAFPYLWDNEPLVKQMKWQSQVAYLLFGFFRDRLKTGEYFSWNQLKSLYGLLPDNLRSLLSTIEIKFDQIKAEIDTREDAESYAQFCFKQNVYMGNKDMHALKAESLNLEIKKSEKLDDSDIDEKLAEFNAALEEKKKFEALLKEPYRISAS